MSTWVLLRGLSREARQWGGFIGDFRRAMPDAAILTPDLPGCGVRRADASPARIDGILDRLRGYLAQDTASPPYRVLGLSLGGMVAVEWAARYPEEVEALVLVGTSLRSMSAFHERLRPRSYFAVARVALALDARARETHTLALTSTRGDPDGTIVDAWTRIRLEAPVSHADVLRQLLAAARFPGPPSAPRAPTLVLASDGDTLVSPACSRAIAERWKAPIAVHPDAGHDLPLDDGPWVARQVRDWCATLPPP